MITKIVKSNNHQVVNIPLSFRFDADMVEILHGENGDVILRPIVQKKVDNFIDLFSGFDDGFIRALEK